MICVTGAERSLEALARRLQAHAADETLQEVRLDLLRDHGGPLFELLARTPRLVVTCRGHAEGGGFKGDEARRTELLRLALACGPEYIDVEISAPAHLRAALFAERGQTRLISSLHRFEPGLPSPEELRALTDSPADLLKVALAVEDAADLLPLMELFPREQRPVLRLGMGDAGLLSRALYRRFASPWTYLVPPGAVLVAPGQFSTAEAQAMRLEHPGLTSLGLVGGSQVMSSPGPPVYNRLFSRRSLPFRYLPVVTRRPLEAMPLLERLGFGGLTVTMPAKEPLVSAAAGWLRPADSKVGALNTLVRQGDGWLAANTDVDALVNLLSPWAGEEALVLGAGGAARAALAALTELGCPRTVTARNADRAQHVASSTRSSTVPWEDSGRQTCRLLLTTTPVGSDGLGDPLPRGAQLRGRVVLDAVLRWEPTPLLRRARAAGAILFSGADWWVRQGAAQLPLLTGYPATVAELELDLAACWGEPR